MNGSDGVGVGIRNGDLAYCISTKNLSSSVCLILDQESHDIPGMVVYTVMVDGKITTQTSACIRKILCKNEKLYV